MKITVSLTGKTLELESKIDARFGRYFHFLIVKIKDKEMKILKRENITAG